jgi:hypothetical protein
VTVRSRPRPGAYSVSCMLREAQWHRVRIGLTLALILVLAGIVVDSLFSSSAALDDSLLLVAGAAIVVALFATRGRG